MIFAVLGLLLYFFFIFGILAVIYGKKAQRLSRGEFGGGAVIFGFIDIALGVFVFVFGVVLFF